MKFNFCSLYLLFYDNQGEEVAQVITEEVGEGQTAGVEEERRKEGNHS